MTFKEHFGMTRNAFNKDGLEPRDAYESADYKAIQSGLAYLQDAKGIGVITADSSIGKTYAVHCFIASLNTNRFTPAYIHLTTVSVQEFYKSLSEAVEAEAKRKGKTELVGAIKNRITQQCLSLRKPYIIFIDEAQYLRQDVLKDIVLLTNFRYDSRNYFILVLCGTPELGAKINKPINAPLKERVVYHYNCVGLTDSEIHDYVVHKLLLSHAPGDLVETSAMNALIGHFDGVGKPRVIDQIMASALILATQMESRTITTDIMQAAIENLILE